MYSHSITTQKIEDSSHYMNLALKYGLDHYVIQDLFKSAQLHFSHHFELFILWTFMNDITLIITQQGC